jgi:hypothetical protein
MNTEALTSLAIFVLGISNIWQVILISKLNARLRMRTRRYGHYRKEKK